MAEVKDYPSNANMGMKPPKKEEKHELKPVATGKVMTKKKSLAKKFKQIFISDDVEDVKGYITDEVIIPTIRDTIWEVITGALAMALGINAGRGRSTGGRSGYTSYGNYSSSKSTRERSSERVRTKSSYSSDDIVMETRGEAEEVISQLCDLIDEYGQATVSDLNQLVGISGQFTDNYWGWESMASASVKRVREGYLLDLPKVISLK